MNTPQAKDLTKEPPRSPKTRIGGYVILGRTLDKCRALLDGNIGDYHFDCPLDNALFGFAGVTGDEVKAQVKSGATDEDVARWLDTHNIRHTPPEVTAWSDAAEASSIGKSDDAEKREYFAEETKKLGLDPETTTTFDWLDADDRASYAGK